MYKALLCTSLLHGMMHEILKNNLSLSFLDFHNLQSSLFLLSLLTIPILALFGLFFSSLDIIRMLLRLLPR